MHQQDSDNSSKHNTRIEPIAIFVCPNSDSVDIMAKNCYRFWNNNDGIVLANGTYAIQSIAVSDCFILQLNFSRIVNYDYFRQKF